MSDLLWSEAAECWYRDDPTDRAILAERSEYAPMNFGRAHRVLDIGAHIGTFALKAIRGGAEDVLSLEPDLANYTVLLKNAALVRSKAITPQFGAAVGHDGDEALLWEHETAHSSHSIVEPARPSYGARHPVVVPAFSFRGLLRTYEPDLVKMDIEGAEYDLWDSIPDPIPKHIKQLAIELHFGRKDWFERRGPALVARIAEQGFAVVRPAKLTGRPWNTTPIWRRR